MSCYTLCRSQVSPFEGEKERMKFSDTSINFNYLYYIKMYTFFKEGQIVKFLFQDQTLN